MIAAVKRSLALIVAAVLTTVALLAYLPSAATAIRPADLSCATTKVQAKAGWTNFGKTYQTQRAGQNWATKANQDNSYGSTRLTIGLLFMAMSCGDDDLVRQIGQSWDPALAERVLYAPPTAGPPFLTWLVRSSVNPATGTGWPCSGGTPTGNRCASNGAAFPHNASSYQSVLNIAATIYEQSVVLNYVSAIPARSRSTWQTTFISNWLPVTKDHLEDWIMRQDWTYAGSWAAPCTGPNTLTPYGTSTTGKLQSVARYAVDNWGTSGENKPACNSVRDSDLFQIAAAALFYGATLADPATFTFTGTTMSATELLNLQNAMNLYARNKTPTHNVTDFTGATKTGRLWQPDAYTYLTGESDYLGDTQSPPPRCTPTAPTLSTSSMTFTDGSATVQVPSTANLLLRSRLFGGSGTAPIPDNGTIPTQAYFIASIVDATHFVMGKTTDGGKTETPGLATSSGTVTVSMPLRTWTPQVGSGEDAEHLGSAFYFFLASFRSLNRVPGITNPITDTMMTEFANQWVYGTWDRSTTYPRFANTQTGANGWYRTGYFTGSVYLAGFEPYETGTAAVVLGWGWFGKFNTDVNVIMARWKQIWEATSGPDYTWRIDNLATGGSPRWNTNPADNTCTRGAGTAYTMSTAQSNPRTMTFYASILSAAATTTTTATTRAHRRS